MRLNKKYDIHKLLIGYKQSDSINSVNNSEIINILNKFLDDNWNIKFIEYEFEQIKHKC